MTTRLAVYNPVSVDGGPDVVLIRRLYTEFFESLGVTGFNLDNVPNTIRNPGSICIVDPDAGAYCQIEAREDEMELEVLLPRDAPDLIATTVLASAFNEVLRRFPERANCRAWTMLPSGRDKDGKPDGGYSILSHWQKRWPVVQLVQEGETWKLVATVEQIANASAVNVNP